MEAVMGVLLGIGLGAACGFRIFVPLLVAAIAIRGGFLTVTPEFAWLGGTAALVTLSVATLLEIAAYYIPVIDHTLDVLGAPAAIVAGTILAAGFIGSMDPMLKWGLAAIAGGGAAGIIHGGMAAIRATPSSPRRKRLPPLSSPCWPAFFPSRPFCWPPRPFTSWSARGWC